jgi:hypothetical protein
VDFGGLARAGRRRMGSVPRGSLSALACGASVRGPRWTGTTAIAVFDQLPKPEHLGLLAAAAKGLGTCYLRRTPPRNVRLPALMRIELLAPISLGQYVQVLFIR